MSLQNAADLAKAGLIDAEAIKAVDPIEKRYAISVTSHLADLIDKNDPACPIALQFIPQPAELETHPGELVDPIGDSLHSPLKGLTHRYPDRVLLTPSLSCPAYCRFCFRRVRAGSSLESMNKNELAAAIAYIRDRAEIWEVVISGGDPLAMPPSLIRELIEALDSIPHVENIRFHSRLPISLPDRINRTLIDALSAKKPVWLAIHCNHAKEISPKTEQALALLSSAGIPLLGQTVLLKGVNDNAETLETLFRAMVKNRVKPYYLHHPDMAPGTGHFRTSIDAGRKIMTALRGRVSGLCLPTYILDIPGGFGKSPIGPDYVQENEIIDWRGHRHFYRSNE